jgi:hypothetical protein
VSKYGAPTLFVKKKDGTWRWCVNFRLLNKITEDVISDMPCMDEYEIKKILTSKNTLGRGGKKLYLVHWCRWGLKYDEWIHEGNLDNAKELVAKFNKTTSTHLSNCMFMNSSEKIEYDDACLLALTKLKKKSKEEIPLNCEACGKQHRWGK